MAPRKRKSDELDDSVSPNAVTTPTGSPQKKMRITQSQKQALIDNLQLEITERARQLRAGYALQCADLRSRIERRVNRIPLSIRKMTMGELAEQYESARSQATKPQTSSKPQDKVQAMIPNKDRPLPAPPRDQQREHQLPSPARPTAQPAPVRGRKRKSSGIQIASDKENENELENLPVIKNTKRAKATTTTVPARQASRSAKTNAVLSPRSHNSRTLPRSPIKEYNHPLMQPISPAKSMIARPISPLKPASPFKSAATAATSAISASVHGMIEQAKRGTAARMTRTASKDKTTTKPSATTTVSSPNKMLPPPRPATSVQVHPSSPQRTISQSSVHSSTTDISTASSSTTVVKPKRGTARAATKPATTKSTEQKSPAGGAARRGVIKAASAAKTALKRNPTSANKKVVVAEPAAGRRVLRKRT